VLLGRRCGRRVTVSDIWLPDNQALFASEGALVADAVSHPAWREEAQAIADSEGLEVVGDIHSHCYRVKGEHERGREPSETDWVKSPPRWLIGICTVSKGKKGVRSSVAFWDAAPPAQLELY
jgi:hypothetical protein